MNPKLIYVNAGGTEAINVTKREQGLLMSRRDAMRRASIFLPLSVFLASRIRAKADSFILNRTIGGLSQNAISMSSATWGRPVTLTGGWSKIRFGIRAHMTNTGANLTGEPIFTMGFNSGTTNQYGSATTQNFGGLAFDRTQWTYSASGTSSYQVLSGAGLSAVFRTRVGTTNTDSSVFTGGGQDAGWNAGAGTNSADRQICFFDVTHGSPNYTFHCPFLFTTNLGANAGDVSASNFLLYMQQLAPTPSEANYGLTLLASQTLAVNEGTNGTWNSIGCYWNRSDLNFEICDIAVAVLA